ncbi:MAG: protein kinase [Anaerolineae bacterium]|nr:protein kinase [Anaerolineae bacterium]
MQDQSVSKSNDPSTYTALRGRSLLAMRIIWWMCVLPVLGLFLASLPVSIQTALTTSSAARMGGGELGLSGPFIAYFRATVDIVTVLAFLGAAILLAMHRSHSWLILFLSMTLVLAGINYTDTFYSLFDATWPPSFMTTLIGSVAALAEICQLTAFFVFPDGHLTPRRLKWLLWVWIPYRLLAWTIGYPHQLSPDIRLIDLFVQLTFFGIGIGAQAYRYRHAETPIHRQQTKWIIFGMSVAVPILILYVGSGITVSALQVPGTARLVYIIAGTVATRLALILIPVSVVGAILRYRLWNIDLLINRSLVYGVLAVLLMSLFVGCTVLIDRLFVSLSGEQSAMIAIAVSGALFGVMFQPAHRQLQAFVDRRLYGISVHYRQDNHITQPIHPNTWHIGTEIHNYELLEPLGTGGMSMVYKGRQPSLNRPVAIKVLPEMLACRPDFRQRFEREARFVAALRHPNIVRLFDFGESGNVCYMIMEYLDGRSLADYLRETGACPLDETCEVISEIAEALDYAHLQGIIHRDVKPSNVMLTPNTTTGECGKRAVLMDFGIAHMVGSMTKLTNAGLAGTFDYISPEQIRDDKNFDGRVDIYSLGVVAFQMLTGRLPFAASNPGALLLAHLQQPAPDPRSWQPDLPAEIATAVLKALEKDPSKRFVTAGAMAEAIRGRP